MNVATVKRAKERIKYPSISNLGILGYGQNNLYPQDLLKIVSASETAMSCRNRRISFIEGNGFLDLKFAEAELNEDGETADDLLKQLAEDMANFAGVAVHINYNILGEPVSYAHIPFENCRLTEPDEYGHIHKIAVHPDWTGRLKRAGRFVQVNKENIDYIDIFNPDPKVVRAQIKEAGGINKYKGQILWFGKGKQTYPIPAHDVAVAYMSTEEGLGNIVNRNVRNGLNPAGVFVIKKGSVPPNDTTEGFENAGMNMNCESGGYCGGNEVNALNDAITSLRGDENTNSIGTIEITNDDEMPQFIKLQGNNYDKDFTVTTQTTTEKIYAIFDQDIFYRIRNGNIGFSSEMMREAYEYYSSVTGGDRRVIERVFDKLFKDRGINPSNDFTLQPLIYVTTENSNATNNTTPAAD